LAPIVFINGKYNGQTTIPKVDQILRKFQKKKVKKIKKKKK
jgi:NADH:ubiquinone oxidoreductase subunit E